MTTIIPPQTQPPSPDPFASGVRLSEIVAALSYALDITEGQPEGHAARSCLIGMRVAEQIQLDADLRPALYYALLLKDLGCSSNAARVCKLFGADDFAAKRDMKTSDWASLPQAALYALRNVAPDGSPLDKATRLLAMGLQGGPLAARALFQTRCDRGASIAAQLGLPPATAEAIRCLDEHWNGKGYPQGLRRQRIPLLARILCLAQTVEIFHATFGVDAARVMARQRRGRWFDPQLVDALEPLWEDQLFWESLAGEQARAQLASVAPAEELLASDDELIDRLAEAFAQVIDAKSPWTYQHSARVAWLSVGIAEELGVAGTDLRDLRRAALLHDIGKLGISSLILDKPGRLSSEEFAEIRRHPVYTRRILERVACFRSIAYMACLHHERLDGSGYPYGLVGGQLPVAARIMAAADFCDALCAERPYRPALPWPEALGIMREQVGRGLDPEVFAALERFLVRLGGLADPSEPPRRRAA